MDSKTQMWLLLAVVLIIIGFSLSMVYFFLKHDYRQRRLEVLAKDNAEIIKLRFQAYERLTLLLERLSPESLVLREQRHDMSCRAFHSFLLKIIRQEFNHNLSMQIYITIPTWQKIQNTREKLIKLINTTAAATNPDGTSLELSKNIIENANTEVDFYFKEALNAIKTEIETYYRR